MATQQSTHSIRMERQKAKDLQKLLSSLNNVTKQQPTLSGLQIMKIVQRYFNNIQNNLQSQIKAYTLSKLNLIQSTNNEINRMRHLIQQLNHHILAPNKNMDISTRQRESVISLSLSPIILSSPDIDIQPIDLNIIPPNFRPRRYSQIPTVYTGKYKIETIAPGNGSDYPYPNDKVTVRYTMFAIDGVLDLMDSYIHEVIDLSSPTCMIGLKYGILSMSTQQKCKLWIPKRLTSYYNDKRVAVTQSCDILIEITLLNIIRSDVYKATTYTNDIVLNANKQRHKRGNTVSLTAPPMTPVAIPKIHEAKYENKKNVAYSFVIDTVEDKYDETTDVNVTELNQQFSVPDLTAFGGHISHQNTDEISNNEVQLLMNEMQQNLPLPMLDMDDDKSVYNASESDNSETNLLDVSGMKSVWMNAYQSIGNNEIVEQCMTLCAKIESCDCTQRLLMILKIYQSIMYNRQHSLWDISERNNAFISMYYVLRNELQFDLHGMIDDFYHCRFYHGHFNRWYEFCRTHFEENYCVYDAAGNGHGHKRHCTIYSRYHRPKNQCKLLSKRREWFKINGNADEAADDGLSEYEINEIITLQICDMLHCFIFHSSQEPYLMYANQYDQQNMNEFKIKQRNRSQTNKFTLNIGNNDSGELFEYDGESFGVLISYKDRTFTPAFTAMKDELINNKLVGGISIHQYTDTTYRAKIFQRTFIGQQMVNFFGKKINLQQIIAIMCYTNFIDLQRAFCSTLHCHNLNDNAMELLRKSHCESFWHFSKMLFSVIDNFGDPIEANCEFICKFNGNYQKLLINDLSFYIECTYSLTSDQITFCDSECKNDDIMVVIGAKRLGSLYFDVSLLSDYPYENEILLGPSQHLEIRNIIINNYDNEIYFNAMYIMDAIIGHKLSFNYEENINYQTYLSQIISNTLSYIKKNDGVNDFMKLEFGQKLCYHYWENKTKLRLNIKSFLKHITIKELIQYFLIEKEGLHSFNFINTVMLFPNVEHIEINHIDLNVFLCNNLLQLIQILNDKNHDINCGQKLNKIQLFGDENNKYYVDFVENLFEQNVTKFARFNWLFQIQTEGNWLFTNTN